MRPYALIYLYRRRLRAHAPQELLAGAGVAIAVALLFAALVAQGSIAGSSRAVVRAVVGPTSLQLHARSGEGFSEALLARVEALRGVKQAAPLLEQSATLTAHNGRRVRVQLAGTDVALATLDGLARTLPLGALTPGGIGLSRDSAQALGIAGTGAGSGSVTLRMRGRASALRVSAVLGREAAGALSQALVAVMPLRRMQQLAGLQGRVTRILVQSDPGQNTIVRGELQRLAGGRLSVAAADEDVQQLQQALRPSDLASEVFAAIGVLLGLLLAFNALLLTVPERRQAIADLRLTGIRRSAVLQMVLFQALCLGLAATFVGLAVGYALSRGVFHQPTGYLAEAFTLSSGTVVSALPLLVASIGGVLATCLASAIPLLDLRRGRARDAVYREAGVPGNALYPGARRWLFAAAVALVALATVLFASEPSAAIACCAMLAAATVLAVPLTFAAVLRAGAGVADRFQHFTVLPVALASLRASTLRSLALAATGAVALFGSVALGGSRDDLLRGIGTFSKSYVADAQIWVTNPQDNQAADTFDPGASEATIARLPAVAAVRAFQGGFLTLGGRRVWVIARPPGASQQVISSQIITGSAPAAVTRLGEGGWVAVSQQIAAEQHTGVGGTMSLPTPNGTVRYRVAATTTNLAWPPGVIFMSTGDFTRAWASPAPTALGVTLRPDVNPAAARQAIAAALGPTSGLEVALAAERAARIDALAGEGLGQLGEISTLLLIAAIGAMAAALISSVWQRRASLASLRLLGVKPRRLRLILALEAALMLAAGCLTGAVVGVYGQLVLDGYLRHVTGFPVARVATGARPLEIFALVLAAAFAIVAVPGWLASRVAPALALEER
ncbi:MAG TPA: FtsX-like permease family protein [Solirubrobacteraceae bacterium]|jgi:putative ABC transport system permease protein|nr:FtsX-like permease family protein [Solirubrobacteraceae bacterium]